jgi:tetratricopeptide (TPR) repeat protein
MTKENGDKPPVTEPEETQEFDQYCRELFWTCVIISLFSVAVICPHWDSTSEAASALLLALSCFGGSAVAGFLFGLPNVRQKASIGTYSIETNSNFDKISDWLTKIILGLGLYKWQDALSSLSLFAQSFDADFGKGEPHAGYAIGIMGFFLPFGFLFGYIGTRGILTMAIAETDQALHSESLGKRLHDVQHIIDCHYRVDMYLEGCRRKRHENKPAQAQHLVDYVLSIDPKNESGLIEKAKIYAMQNCYEDAAETLEELLEYTPDSPVGLYNYGIYVILQHYHSSRRKTEKMSEPRVQKVIQHWEKAFDQIPELQYLASTNKDVKNYLPLEPKINALVRSSKNAFC